jgi:MinD-like ATPase involved in chromosome partitioning or flagellar assembly
MVCPHCSEKIDLFKIGGGEQAAKELGVVFLGRIPIDPLVVHQCDAGRPFVAEPSDSVAKTAFAELVGKLLDRLEWSEEGAGTVH